MPQYNDATENSVILTESDICGFYVGRQLSDGRLELYGGSSFPVRHAGRFRGAPREFFSYEDALETQVKLNKEIKSGDPVWIVYLKRVDPYFPNSRTNKDAK